MHSVLSMLLQCSINVQSSRLSSMRIVHTNDIVEHDIIEH